MTNNLETADFQPFREISLEAPESLNTSNKFEPDPKLRNGRVLPKRLQTQFASTNLWGKPLEEIDPFYQTKDTFIVVSSNFRIYRFSSHNSMYLFDRLSGIRRFCLQILTHRIFDVFMTAAVLVSFFCISQPIIYWRIFPRTYVVYSVLRVMYPFVFVFEFLLKLVAYGFIMSPYTYLRSGWGWVDLVTVLGSLSHLISGAAEIVIFDTIWLLDFIMVLKIIPYNQGLHFAFDFFISCIVELKEMLISSFAIVSLFAIMGVHLFMGTLTQKCISHFNLTAALNYTGEDFDRQWHSQHSNWFTQFGDLSSVEFPLCGFSAGSAQCPEGYTCVQGFGPNPNYGITNFDSFGWAFVSVLRLVTQNSPEILYKQLAAANGPHVHGIYFILIFLFGTFTLGTFAYAVVTKYFLDKQSELEMSQEDEIVHHDNSNANRFFSFCTNWNFSPRIDSFRTKIHNVTAHPFIEICLTTIILLDVILLTLNINQIVLAQIFCFIYAIEFIVKLLAEVPLNCLLRNEQILNFLIVLVFMSTWFVTSINSSFLVIRMLKLYPRWPSLNFFVQSIINSLRANWNLFFFFGLTFLLVAVQCDMLFNAFIADSDWKVAEPVQKWDYYTLSHSFMLTFRVLTGDWIESVWVILSRRETATMIYFIPTVFILYLLLKILSIAVVIATGEAITKNDCQDDNVYSNLQQALQKIYFPIAWLRNKLNRDRDGASHELLETPIHEHSVDNIESEMVSNPSAQINEDNQEKSIIIELIESKYYNWFAIVVIVCSITIVASNPIYGGHHTENGTFEIKTRVVEETLSEYKFPNHKLIMSEIFFVVFFTLDILLKLYSCLVRKRFDEPGTIFDAVLVITTFIDFLPFHRIWLEPLRPFMLVSRIGNLKVVLHGLLTEIAIMGKYVLAALFIWLMFINQGIQLFSGQFYKCLDPITGKIIGVEEYTNHTEGCLRQKGIWKNSVKNFDNVVNGFYSILSLATFNGWTEIFNDATDTHRVERQPHMRDQYYNAFYFVLFVIFGVFFVFNTLVGILAHHLRNTKCQGIFLTPEQSNEYKERIRNLDCPDETSPPQQKIPEPRRSCFKFCYNIVGNHFFDKFIMALIIVDIFLLAFYHYKISQAYILMFLIYEHLLMLVYILEMIIKLLGWRSHYFKNVYNRWDFVIVLTIIIDVLVTELHVFENYWMSPQLLKMIRVFRIFQFEPFKRRAVLTQKFLRAFSLIKSALFNLLYFLILSMCSFAFLFHLEFNNVKLRAGLSKFVNFQSFGSSLSMMVQLSSFGGWDGIYEGLSDDTDCNPPYHSIPFYSDCGKPIVSALLIGSYIFLSFIIVLNMYILFILQILNIISKRQSYQLPQQTVEPAVTPLRDSEFSASSDPNHLI